MLCHFFQMLFHLFHFCISVFVYLCISPSPHPQSILSLTHLQTMTSRKKFCDNRLELVMKVIKYLKKGKDIKKEVYMENKLKKRNKLIIIKTILWWRSYQIVVIRIKSIINFKIILFIIIMMILWCRQLWCWYKQVIKRRLLSFYNLWWMWSLKDIRRSVYDYQNQINHQLTNYFDHRDDLVVSAVAVVV